MRTSGVGTSRVTLHDVAARVGVSARTVSRVINGEGGFSSLTEARVQAAVDELGYKPNMLARALVRNTSDSFGFIIPTIGDPFFPELSSGVHRAADEAGRTMFVALSNGEPDTEARVLDQLLAHAIEGAIVFPGQQSLDLMRRYVERGLRLVLIDDHLDHPGAASVTTALHQGARSAVAHLGDRGRRSIAFLSAPSAPHKYRRLHGYNEEIVGRGLEPIVITCEATVEGGRRGATQLLEGHRDVDAIFAFNDLMAIGAMEVVQQSGRSVPDDVAIVGCDGIVMGRHTTPTLTSVEIDRETLGRLAVEQLVALTTNSKPEPITLPVTLVERASA